MSKLLGSVERWRSLALHGGHCSRSLDYLEGSPKVYPKKGSGVQNLTVIFSSLCCTVLFISPIRVSCVFSKLKMCLDVGNGRSRDFLTSFSDLVTNS